MTVETILQKSKKRCQTEGLVDKVEGIFRGISGCEFQGYEIHMGETRYADCSVKDDAIVPFPSDDLKQRPVNKVVVQSEKYENVYGSYVHGIFDQAEIANAILRALGQK